VDNQNGVVAGSRDVGDKLIAALPECKVVAITIVSLNLEVSLP